MTVGPSVNGRVFDPGNREMRLSPRHQGRDPSRVLNDALLRAAVDLGAASGRADGYFSFFPMVANRADSQATKTWLKGF